VTATTAPDTKLTAQELAAGRGMLRVQAALLRQMDAELTAAHGLPLRSYEVLLHLEDAAGHRQRMTELCRDVVLSASGVSRLVDRLEKDGYVRRERCTYDGRGFFAVLTPDGERKLREARATHLAGVRRLFLERLQTGDLACLAQYWEVLVPGSTAPTADSRPDEGCA
jgi:DNA-binding MarR family transcriptional regulator